MKIQLQNIKQNNIFIFDIEYDQTLLVQLSFLILSKCEPTMFDIVQSTNIYMKVNQSLSSFFTHYTNITNAFLCDNGIDLAVARTLVRQDILNINPIKNDWLIVSHGLKNDITTLERNGFSLQGYNNRYCTYNHAKKLLHRNERLTLRDVAAEGKYFMFNEHNAYADVWGTLYAFAYLNELENTRSRNEII